MPASTTNTVRDALRIGTAALGRHRCPGVSPAREAEELLGWAAGVTREALFTHPEARVGAAAMRKFRAALRRRVAHEPVEYIVGRAQFLGREFRVTRATLIPRPATETIVEEAIIDARRADRPSFVDVGTGSGAIAVSLATAFPESYVLATDLSPAALAVARGNAARAGAADRIAFVRADLLPPSPPRAVGTTYVLANLPYIPERTYAKLAPEVRRYEPRTALVSGGDGLSDTKRLIDRLSLARFEGPLRVYLELLPGQCRRAIAYARKRFPPGTDAREISNAQDVAIGIRIASN